MSFWSCLLKGKEDQGCVDSQGERKKKMVEVGGSCLDRSATISPFQLHGGIRADSKPQLC